MKDKSCFFVGHRHAPDSIREKLIEVVKRHIVEYGVTTFTVGHYGKFDSIVQTVLSDFKRQYPELILNLLLPYHPVHQEVKTLAGFVAVYPDGLERVPKRYAIVKANKNQIDNSDYLISYCKYIGNTRNFVEYAQRREKKGLIKVTLL